MKIWSETASCFKMRKLSVLLKVSLENHDASKKKKSVEVGNFFFFLFFFCSISVPTFCAVILILALKSWS